jgi:replicative DNA helicase
LTPNNNEELIQATHDAEDSLIGSILIESNGDIKDAINAVAKILTPAHFHSWNNRQIYTAMLSCPNSPTVVNVTKQLQIMNLLEQGMRAHMALCISIIEFSPDYPDYALAVKHYAEARKGTVHRFVRGVSL